MPLSRVSSAMVAAGACVALMAMVPFFGEGIYTRAQAARGRGFYDGGCASCHGSRLEGGSSGPLSGDQFTASWARPNLTLDDFYFVVRKTMPKDTPGSLSREQYADVVAYILQQNGFPAGDKELTPDPVLMKSIRFAAPAPGASFAVLKHRGK